MAISKEEVAASMARIKALQAMLAGGGAEPEPEEEYDPNDPNQQYQEETEEDIKWREEQERKWEEEQAAAKAATTVDNATATTAAAPVSAPAAAVSSSSSSLPVAPAAGPHQWTNSQLSNWIQQDVKSEIKKRGEIFSAKGWTKEEVTKWLGEVDAAFTAANSKLEASKLTGAQAAAFDISTDTAWGQQLGLTDPFLRAAVWGHWKEALRKWQSTQKK
jgi:E3 ubiquitin-protein ligase DOA10